MIFGPNYISRFLTQSKDGNHNQFRSYTQF